MFRHGTLAAAVAMTVAYNGLPCHANEPTMAGYVPKSHITGSRIDLDLLEMKELMASGDFDRATTVFREGGHSDPYAKITLSEPLRHDIGRSADTGRLLVAVVGLNHQNQPVVGRIDSAHKGSSVLYVKYQDASRSGGNDDETTGHCHVGPREDPRMEGCLAHDGGLVIQDYGAVDYYYNPEDDNKFDSTLYGFSEHEGEKMLHCETSQGRCNYVEYQHFYDYYGQLDFGALWMEAALEGRATNYRGNVAFDHGQEDFGLLNARGRAAAIETAAITMNLRTRINQIMIEGAIDRCREVCREGEICHAAMEPWDLAVAHYTGSLVQPNTEAEGGFDDGHLYYALANDLCKDFATCGINGNDVEGTAFANHAVMQHFKTGHVLLEQHSCTEAQLKSYNQVVFHMMIPVIQGTLRSAYRLQHTHRNDSEEKGRAAAFAAAILPDLYACSKDDARIVYENMKISSGSSAPDFEEVKAAFERNYNCLQVTCEDVGGLLDAASGEYVPGGQPCGLHRRASKRGKGRSPVDGGEASWEASSASFLLCSMAVFAVLAVTRKRWVPAVSGQADHLLSRASLDGGSLRLGSSGSHGRTNEGYEMQPSANYHQIPELEDSML